MSEERIKVWSTQPGGTVYFQPPAETTESGADARWAWEHQWTAEDVRRASAEGRHADIEQARIDGQLREVLA